MHSAGFYFLEKDSAGLYGVVFPVYILDVG
jgi:hypothetical protein